MKTIAIDSSPSSNYANHQIGDTICAFALPPSSAKSFDRSIIFCNLDDKDEYCKYKDINLDINADTELSMN